VRVLCNGGVISLWDLCLYWGFEFFDGFVQARFRLNSGVAWCMVFFYLEMDGFCRTSSPRSCILHTVAGHWLIVFWVFGSLRLSVENVKSVLCNLGILRERSSVAL
jgi:hypothetical protein